MAARDKAAGASLPAADNPRYVVVSPVRHDGTHYAPDAEIVLSAADAALLLALGAIRER